MTSRDATLDALKLWRESVVGLNRRSRLIHFKPTKKSSLSFDAPHPDEILALLQSGKLLNFIGEPDEDDRIHEARQSPGNSLHVAMPEKDIGSVARNLMRRATQEFLDRGLSVLYMAFGMLRWKDVDGSDMASPLYLVPVELVPEGPRVTPRLRASEDDPVLNTALQLRLAEYGVQWPTLEEVEDLGLTEILELFRAALSESRDLKGWDVLPEVHLATFSFSKEAMYKDLLDNESLIVDHPVVQALANPDPTRQTDAFQFEPVDPIDIDEVAPPEKTPLVLDADSSQRAAIAASIAGRSFVMDGPPGTGKSQTIANMIGALMHAGKSVLFVSEKMAALDVVRNRLRDVGLGSYLLELHSHKANRREVAQELMKTLDNVAQPPGGMSAPSRAALEERRKKLNSYAMAMNEIRSPLELSLHDVLGTLAELFDVPLAPVPARPPLMLSQAGLSRLRETLGRLERTWRPAAQGQSFLWREVIDDTSLETRLWTANNALEELRGTMSLNAELAEAFGIQDPDQAHIMDSLLELQHHSRPPVVNDKWLSSAEWDSIFADRQELGSLVDAHRTRADEVLELCGAAYDSFPREHPVVPKPPQVASAIDVNSLTLSELETSRSYLQHHSNALGAVLPSLRSLANVAGFAEPIDWAEADRVIRAIELRTSDPLIESAWLSVSGLQSAREAATKLRMKVMDLEEAEDRAKDLYRPDALSAPLYELRDRFENLHKGLRKLSGEYRKDKRELAALLSDAKQIKYGISRLSDAIAWSEANKGFETVSLVHSQALGRHWKGRETDWEALEHAFTVAEEVIALSSGTVSPQTVHFFTTSTLEPAHQQMVSSAKSAIRDWRESLAPEPALAGRPELLVEPINNSLEWMAGHLEPVDTAVELVEAVNDVTGRDHTLGEAKAILQACELAREAAAELEAAHDQFAPQFGSLFQGVETELSEIDTALKWALAVRELVPGNELSAPQLEAMKSSNPVEPLSQALLKWEDARDAILAAFGEGRRAELLEDFATFQSAFELIKEFKSDTVGQQEWFDYSAIRQELREHDLDSTVEFCIENRIPASEVPKVVERALLRSWADAHIRDDDRLHPLGTTERSALVEDFKTLDLELIAAATGDIIRSANMRRPATTSIGEPALISREGMKQRKHMPVRSLISRATSTIQAIKPVFMMSPLAVSQYLPPDIKFDVVIFDEASQVKPEDSINCIYRGRSLILAGDDKQLPPPQFFERAVESDEDEVETDVQDFQSVLELAKSSGAFQNLGLRWHYRSRHEALIAFSNYRFYEGKLITYPSAQQEGSDVGVEFFLTDGMYRRGGGADNPKEARFVAERVIHHYRTRPESSLGVVTFSVAQADAVLAAIDELRESNRDLDGYFDSSNRLDGFFVRSLESVQGDERDVIIFSIGYGPDEAGKISTNFGVLNKEKGWRRLNVGITRARQRIEVVASMEAHDIPASPNENVEALRAYLDYARRGVSALGTQSTTTHLMPESPFEESVIRRIESWGYSVEPQVGAAGFRIDMAVRHPAKPGMFVLGVECDGYQYHSSPAARDRDRLRDQVLEGLGWTMHRIWSTAWYRDREIEEKRLRAAIEEAIAGKKTRNRSTTFVRPDVDTVPADTEEAYSWAVGYKEAAPETLPPWVDPGAPGSYLNMVEPLMALAGAEGPVHMDIVNERVRDWWDIGRISSRIRNNIDKAIAISKLQKDGDFIDIQGRPVKKVRCIDHFRKPEQVHLDEFALAAEHLVRDVGGASRSEVVTHIARLYGWARNGAVLDERLNQAIERAIDSGRLRETNQHLTVAVNEETTTEPVTAAVTGKS